MPKLVLTWPRLTHLAIGLMLFGLAGCRQERSSDPTSSNRKTAMSSQTSTGEHTSDTLPSFEYTPVQRAHLGSVDEAKATLKSVGDLYQSANMPGTLPQGFGARHVQEIAQAVNVLRTQLSVDVQWLKNIDFANLPGIDQFSAQQLSNSRTSLLSRLETSVPADLQRAVDATRETLQVNIETHQLTIQRAADVNMSDQTAVRNLLSDERQNRIREENVQLVAACYDALIAFDQVLGQPDQWSSKRQEFQQILQTYRDKVSRAVEAIMPPADIGDAELLEIATQVFACQPEQPVRIVVNAGKRTNSEVRYHTDTGAGTVTRTPYRWEEFHVATIEQDQGRYYLWYNTLLRYSEGPHTVPVGKWVLGPRHRSAAIAKANIDK